MSDNVVKFIDALNKSLAAGEFVKLTLGNYKGREEHLQKVGARTIETRKGPRFLIQYRYDTREIAKNYDLSEAGEHVRKSIDSGFRSGHLFTTAGDLQLTIGKKSVRLLSGKPTYTETPTKAHDRVKTKLIDPTAFYLNSLGITTDVGKVRSQQQDKWRQINKYVEILRDLFDTSPLKTKGQLRLIDMGSGKGYLTFAAYDYFANVRGLTVEMTGVEARPELVELCKQISEAAGYDGLRFESGTIRDFHPGPVDILIALHACDTATDDALYKGIAGNAEIIVAAPCCHKEIRRQIKPPDVLEGILRHGSMLEREAEMITDGLRMLLLERSGYATKIIEFVPLEQTPKNNMIVASRTHGGHADVRKTQAKIDALKEFYGVRQQHLENLLA